MWFKYDQDKGMICECVEDEVIFRKKVDDNMTMMRESFQTTSQRIRCQRDTARETEKRTATKRI